MGLTDAIWGEALEIGEGVEKLGRGVGLGKVMPPGDEFIGNVGMLDRPGICSVLGNVTPERIINN